MSDGFEYDTGKVRAALPIQDFPRALVADAEPSTPASARAQGPRSV